MVNWRNQGFGFNAHPPFRTFHRKSHRSPPAVPYLFLVVQKWLPYSYMFHNSTKQNVVGRNSNGLGPGTVNMEHGSPPCWQMEGSSAAKRDPCGAFGKSLSEIRHQSFVLQSSMLGSDQGTKCSFLICQLLRP